MINPDQPFVFGKGFFKQHQEKLLINWTESDEIPGWGKGIDLVKRFN